MRPGSCQILNSNILILGFTFKENCPDVRNTKVIDIYKSLKEYNVNIVVYDPWADPVIVKHEYEIEMTNKFPEEKYDAVVLAVAHEKFHLLDFFSLTKENAVVFDVKGVYKKDLVDGRL